MDKIRKCIFLLKCKFLHYSLADEINNLQITNYHFKMKTIRK